VECEVKYIKYMETEAKETCDARWKKVKFTSTATESSPILRDILPWSRTFGKGNRILA
jgi:hypothetical protein